jgi:hypothetical protein
VVPGFYIVSARDKAGRPSHDGDRPALHDNVYNNFRWRHDRRRFRSGSPEEELG